MLFSSSWCQPPIVETPPQILQIQLPQPIRKFAPIPFLFFFLKFYLFLLFSFILSWTSQHSKSSSIFFNTWSCFKTHKNFEFFVTMLSVWIIIFSFKNHDHFFKSTFLLSFKDFYYMALFLRSIYILFFLFQAKVFGVVANLVSIVFSQQQINSTIGCGFWN